jgi:hypothetical protein
MNLGNIGCQVIDQLAHQLLLRAYDWMWPIPGLRRDGRELTLASRAGKLTYNYLTGPRAADPGHRESVMTASFLPAQHLRRTPRATRCAVV